MAGLAIFGFHTSVSSQNCQVWSKLSKYLNFEIGLSIFGSLYCYYLDKVDCLSSILLWFCQPLSQCFIGTPSETKKTNKNIKKSYGQCIKYKEQLVHVPYFIGSLWTLVNFDTAHFVHVEITRMSNMGTRFEHSVGIQEFSCHTQILREIN